jgi:hypothetical protein
MCCLQHVSSFLGVFPSDLLPQHSTARSGTLIVNTDPHIETGSHWLAIHFQSRSFTAYYFDSYGLPPFIHSIEAFIRRNCTVWDYNSVQLQEPTTAVCGKYCCPFALYVDRGYTPQQFVGLLSTVDAYKLVSEMFESEFGPLHKMPRGGGQCNVSSHKR